MPALQSLAARRLARQAALQCPCGCGNATPRPRLINRRTPHTEGTAQPDEAQRGAPSVPALLVKPKSPHD
jgi:hypothetical protein